MSDIEHGEINIRNMEREQLQNDIKRINQTIEDMSHIILEANGIDLRKDQKFNIDFKNKKIII